jgi:hypothetical protein
MERSEKYADALLHTLTIQSTCYTFNTQNYLNASQKVNLDKVVKN